MWRTIASIIGGLVDWAVVVTILNFGLRAAIPGYHAAEATLQFTPAMKLGRLIEAAMASIGRGRGRAAGSRRRANGRRGSPALIVLAMFLPGARPAVEQIPGLVSSGVPASARAAGRARSVDAAARRATAAASPPSRKSRG